MILPAFQTAFDPSDLPGGSIDPLGFDKSYTALAEALVPHLSNVANVPRYFSVLCAGIRLAAVPADAERAERAAIRRKTVLRAERIWGMACALAETEELPINQLRGVTYVRKARERLLDDGDERTKCDYRLLSRQPAYGVLGIYSAVGARLRLFERRSFDLSGDLGEPLAEAFIRDTKMPRSVKRAIEEGRDVSVADLAAWGARAHVSDTPGWHEGRLLTQALLGTPERERIVSALLATPREEGESELEHLLRVAAVNASTDPELTRRLELTCAFEDVYRELSLAFEHLLTFDEADAEAWRESPVLAGVRQRLPAEVSRLERLLDEPSPTKASGLPALRDLWREAAQAPDVQAFCRVLLERHITVQSGKFDGGRRKGPWLKLENGRLTRTLAPVGRVTKNATMPTHIEPHVYRTAAACEFVFDGLEVAG